MRRLGTIKKVWLAGLAVALIAIGAVAVLYLQQGGVGGGYTQTPGGTSTSTLTTTSTSTVTQTTGKTTTATTTLTQTTGKTSTTTTTVTTTVTQTIGEVSVPLYIGSQAYTPSSGFTQFITMPSGENTTVKVYYKIYYVRDVTASEVLRWYKENAKDCTLVDEYPLTSMSTPYGTYEFGNLIFKKGNYAFVVVVIGGQYVEQLVGRGVIYYIFTGPLSQFLVGGEELPDHDLASGEEVVQRYPGSVMLSYEKVEGGYNATYGTRDYASSIISWYKDQLTGEGWNITSAGGDDYRSNLQAKRGDETVWIKARTPSSVYEGSYTVVSVYYQRWVSVQPRSSFAIEVDNAVRSLALTISRSNPENPEAVVTLIYCNENQTGNTFNVTLKYRYWPPMEDVPAIAPRFKDGLVNAGFSVIDFSASDNFMRIVFSGPLAGRNVLATLEVMNDQQIFVVSVITQ